MLDRMDGKRPHKVSGAAVCVGAGKPVQRVHEKA